MREIVSASMTAQYLLRLYSEPWSERRGRPIQQPIPCEARPGQASPAVASIITAGYRRRKIYTREKLGRIAEEPERMAGLCLEEYRDVGEDLPSLSDFSKSRRPDPQDTAHATNNSCLVARRYCASGPATNLPAFITPTILSRSRSTSIRLSGFPFRITRSASIPLVTVPTES